MSAKNVEKKTIIINKGEKLINRKNIKKSPFKKDIEISNNNMNNSELNMTIPSRELNIFKNSANRFINEIKGIMEQTISPNPKNKYYSKMSKSPNEYGYNDNSYMFPINNREISLVSDTNTYNANKTNITNPTKNKVVKMKSLQNVKITNKKKNNTNNNTKSSFISNNNANIIKNDNITNSEPYDSKYSVKINKIKDDYIDFLQKGYEDNTKQNAQLDTNNKELLKKCDDLINDNRILTNTLNDRTSQLNKIIQENLMVKSELDKCILNNQKNEQKLEFYEEQFNLFKSSNDNYQKIIKELKEQNDQLNLGLTEMQKKSEANLINSEENFKLRLKEEIENTKNKMEEYYNNRKLEQSDISEKKMQVFLEQIKDLQEKNNQLINELTNKEHMLDLACKENEKLANENNLYRTQLDQYSHQIGELNTIIKHKDNIIANLKQENFNNEKNINKSSSCSMMKFDGNEYFNENISRLINDNEENKMKIELLNDKIKSIDEIEKKYNEIMNGKSLSLSEKLAFHLSMNNTSPKNIPTHFNYNTIHDVNSSYQKTLNNKNISKTIISPKKLTLKTTGIYNVKSPEINRIRYERNDYNRELISKNKTNSNNFIVYSSNINKDNRYKNINETVKERNKNNYDREIKVTKKGYKIPEKDRNQNDIISPMINKTKRVEINIPQIKGRYYHRIEELNNRNNNYEQNGKQVIHGKELETEKDEVKESIREMNRKKNYTHKPKNLNYSLEEMKNGQNNGEQLVSLAVKDEEEKKVQENILYLYGIDRNDILHIFDVNNKRWEEMKRIPDLVDKSDTFKKDYQYEGTLLYNTLYGVYILTGEKTDTLYYYSSRTNYVTKICKFNYCHDNGSIMYDARNNCLYVFGGKKITSCEYYSFLDKKVYKLPDLITDRANASFIVSNNKIFGFFGFSYGKNSYAKTIEYMDYIKKDKWFELNNINFLKNDISFDTESVSTMYFRQNPDQILIYCGIQGDDEDFVTEYYLLYDVNNNSMDKISKWNMQQYKSVGKRWKNYNFKKNDPKGFHFAKNTRFLLLPKGSYEGYNERDPIDIMIDYKNNVHYILQEKQKIDVYRSDL